MPPLQGSHSNPQTRESVITHGKVNLTDVIQVGNYPRLSGWTQSNHKLSYKQVAEGHNSGAGNVEQKQGVGVM